MTDDHPAPSGPRDLRGRFVRNLCDVCGYGRFHYHDSWWECDGLTDPGHPDKPLTACTNAFEGLPP